MTDLADVLDVMCTKGYFVKRSMHTNIFFFIPQVNGGGPAKSNSISWFGSTTNGSFPRFLCFERCFRFLPALKHLIGSLRDFGFLGKFLATRCKDLPDFSMRFDQDVLQVADVA